MRPAMETKFQPRLRRSWPVRLTRRLPIFLAALAMQARSAFAEDWGMGDANSKLSLPDVFAPASSPAHEIRTLAWFVIAITAAILVVVGGLLVYAIVRFRARPGDDAREPPQVYGSNPIEFAWTVVPLLIVFVLTLTTASAICTPQDPPRPPTAINVRATGQ